MRNFTTIRYFAMAAFVAGVSACTVHPAGEREERDAAAQSGKPFEKRFEDRHISRLAENATVDQLVEYALINSAELERRYWEWRSAIEQIPQDASQSSTLNIAAGTAITNGRASWGSSTAALANDPMTDIKWPGKLDAAGKAALQNAKAAGERFMRAKYDLRSKLLEAYYDYALNGELIRLDRTNLQILETMASVTQARSRAGSSNQLDVLKASNEIDLSRNEIAEMESQLPAQRAAINALLGRTADAPLAMPVELPVMKAIAYTDEDLIELAARRNPELAALADEIRGRAEGIRLAKLQYVPDFNLSAGTDLMGVTQSILGQATIPVFRYEAVNAAIAQAEANLRGAEAMRRQAGNDLAAEVMMDIAIVRDADRQLDLFEHGILPRTREMVELGRAGYETAQASLLDLLEEERSLIGVERLIANLKVTRVKRVAELEAITAGDLSKQETAILEDGSLPKRGKSR